MSVRTARYVACESTTVPGERLGRAGFPGSSVTIGRDERVAEPAADRLAHRLEHIVVLAGREVGTVFLDAAGENQRRGLAAANEVADFEHREVLDPHAVVHVDGPRHLAHVHPRLRVDRRRRPLTALRRLRRRAARETIELQSLSALIEQLEGEARGHQLPARPAVAADRRHQPAAQGAAPGRGPSAGARAARPDRSRARRPPTPTPLYRTAYNDYLRGNYDLAILGFRQYLESFSEHRPGRQRLLLDRRVLLPPAPLPGRHPRVRRTSSTSTPTATRSPSALLRKGYAYLELGEQSQGRRAAPERHPPLPAQRRGQPRPPAADERSELTPARAAARIRRPVRAARPPSTAHRSDRRARPQAKVDRQDRKLMANTKSAEKRMRQSAERRERNRAARSAMRTAVKKVRGAVEAGDAQAGPGGAQGRGAGDRPHRHEERRAPQHRRAHQVAPGQGGPAGRQVAAAAARHPPPRPLDARGRPRLPRALLRSLRAGR